MFSPAPTRVVLTYGAFDLFHQGHARFLRRLAALGSEVIVGCTTDAHADVLGRPLMQPYAQRRLMLESCRFVSRVIAEQDPEQKYTDIINYNVSVFAMGDDCTGQYDHLEDVTQVIYLPRAGIRPVGQSLTATAQPIPRRAAGR